MTNWPNYDWKDSKESSKSATKPPNSNRQLIIDLLNNMEALKRQAMDQYEAIFEKWTDLASLIPSTPATTSNLANLNDGISTLTKY